MSLKPVGKLDLPKIDKEIQDFWNENDILNKHLDSHGGVELRMDPAYNPGGEPYVPKNVNNENVRNG
jgi:hypothetical protein